MIGLAPSFYQSHFVAADAQVKPDRRRDRDQRGEQRFETQRQADKEDDVPRVHRIARVSVWPGQDQTLGRRVETGTAAAAFSAIDAAQAVLQIAPEHQRQKNRLKLKTAMIYQQLPGGRE